MTQKSISFYDSTGKITGYSHSEISVMDMMLEERKKHPEADPYVEGNWFEQDVYVLNGIVTPRPECPATISGNVLQNLPVPCKILINGKSYDCSDQTATLELAQPIKYAIVVSAFPYLDKEFVIDYSAH